LSAVMWPPIRRRRRCRAPVARGEPTRGRLGVNNAGTRRGDELRSPSMCRCAAFAGRSLAGDLHAARESGVGCTRLAIHAVTPTARAGTVWSCAEPLTEDATPTGVDGSWTAGETSAIRMTGDSSCDADTAAAGGGASAEALQLAVVGWASVKEGAARARQCAGAGSGSARPRRDRCRCSAGGGPANASPSALGDEPGPRADPASRAGSASGAVADRTDRRPVDCSNVGRQSGAGERSGIVIRRSVAVTGREGVVVGGQWRLDERWWLTTRPSGRTAGRQVLRRRGATRRSQA